MRVRSEEVNARREEAVMLKQDSSVFDRQLEAMDNEVTAYQDSILSHFPDAVTSVLIRGNRDVIIPEFEAEGDELQRLRFYYYRDHYFDGIDLGDSVVLRTPFLHNKLERYLDKLIIQMPDSIIVAVDDLLHRMEPSMETWKFYVAHFLNKYGKSQIIGMDAVYVHMVDTYYATGRTPWANQETLDKIIDEAEKMKPVLLGKIAPDVTLFTEDNQPVRLLDIESPFTVLIFWAPDCGHCKKSMPLVNDFHEKFKDKGVTTIAVCTKHMDKTADCWEYIRENKLENLSYHLADQYHRSRFQVKYNIRTTPQVFILDKDKKILIKRLAIEKLEEVMPEIMQIEAAKTQD